MCERMRVERARADKADPQAGPPLRVGPQLLLAAHRLARLDARCAFEDGVVLLLVAPVPIDVVPENHVVCCRKAAFAAVHASHP